jgi:hypothetical protein
LRRERQQSPRTHADAVHITVKTQMPQLRLMEKRRELVRSEDVNALLDEIRDVMLMHLSGLAARCSNDPDGAAQDRCRRASGPHRDRRTLHRDRR